MPEDRLSIFHINRDATTIDGPVTNSTIIVAPQIKALYDDRQVRDGLAGAVEPLAHPGIDTFLAKREGRIVESIEKTQAEYFEPRDDPGLEVLIYENEHPAAYSIVKPVLAGDLTWVLSDGAARFEAKIEDGPFLERVRLRQYVFGAGDVLFVQVAEKITRRPDGRLKNERRILRVLDVKQATDQTGLWDQPRT